MITLKSLALEVNELLEQNKKITDDTIDLIQTAQNHLSDMIEVAERKVEIDKELRELMNQLLSNTER